jgi:hypothetical protein
LKLDFDADLLSLTTGKVYICTVPVADMGVRPDQAKAHPLKASPTGSWDRVQGPDLRHVSLSDEDGAVIPTTITLSDDNVITNAKIVRRLTKIDGTNLQIVLIADDTSTGDAAATLKAATDELVIEFAMADNLKNGGANGAIVGDTAWEMESSSALPEIAIKVDSTAITAVTRKLKASWTPELAQDLNAYHNLDAEVELTGILSEQIALEIDQEILSDLISGAKANKLYWSRRPGLFVNRVTGADATSLDSPPDFTGSVSEWYETLIETINDVSADIHRKTLRGGANFLVCGPEVANILEFTTGFRASVTHDDATGSVGAVQIGSINKKWDLHVDPYFPRNVVLVGRKGSSFLESGFVYAPYVPLQVTPTIFNTEDFTPRKAVMTRYGKKMVRPDMYGLVVVRDLEG